MDRAFIKALFVHGIEIMMDNYTMNDIMENKWKM